MGGGGDLAEFYKDAYNKQKATVKSLTWAMSDGSKVIQYLRQENESFRVTLQALADTFNDSAVGVSVEDLRQYAAQIKELLEQESPK